MSGAETHEEHKTEELRSNLKNMDSTFIDHTGEKIFLASENLKTTTAKQKNFSPTIDKSGYDSQADEIPPPPPPASALLDKYLSTIETVYKARILDHK